MCVWVCFVQNGAHNAMVRAFEYIPAANAGFLVTGGEDGAMSVLSCDPKVLERATENTALVMSSSIAVHKAHKVVKIRDRPTLSPLDAKYSSCSSSSSSSSSVSGKSNRIKRGKAQVTKIRTPKPY